MYNSGLDDSRLRFISGEVIETDSGRVLKIEGLDWEESEDIDQFFFYTQRLEAITGIDLGIDPEPDTTNSYMVSISIKHVEISQLCFKNKKMAKEVYDFISSHLIAINNT